MNTLRLLQSDPENPHLADDLSVERVELRRFDASLRRKILLQLNELLPEEGEIDDAFYKMLDDYCRLVSADTAAGKACFAELRSALPSQDEEKPVKAWVEVSHPSKQPTMSANQTQPTHPHRPVTGIPRHFPRLAIPATPVRSCCGSFFSIINLQSAIRNFLGLPAP